MTGMCESGFTDMLFKIILSEFYSPVVQATWFPHTDFLVRSTTGRSMHITSSRGILGENLNYFVK